MVLSSIGVYGLLSRTRIEHALAGNLTVANKAANIDARLEAKQAHLNDLKARISQLDQTQTVATKGHTKTNTVCDRGPAREKLIYISTTILCRVYRESCQRDVPKSRHFNGSRMPAAGKVQF
jgi:hypothetical protein